jgi:hypothetical protein
VNIHDSKDADGNTIINEEQADIVRRIYKLYLNNISGCKIAQMLNDEKIPTFTDHPWSSDRIMRIISNEKYVGDCLLQKAYVNEAGRNVINRGERPKYYVKDAHPAIVSRADWLKAQDIRAGRKKTVYPLTGLIRCPYCGASLIHVIHQKRWISWICRTYMSKGKAACVGMRISDSQLQDLTRDRVITQPMVLKEVNCEEHSTGIIVTGVLYGRLLSLDP